MYVFYVMIYTVIILYILYTYDTKIINRFSRQRDLNVSNFTVGFDDSLFERVHKFPSMMSALIGRRTYREKVTVRERRAMRGEARRVRSYRHAEERLSQRAVLTT